MFVLPCSLAFKAAYCCIYSSYEVSTIEFFSRNFLYSVPGVGSYLLEIFHGHVDVILDPKLKTFHDFFGGLTICGGIGSSLALALVELCTSYSDQPQLLGMGNGEHLTSAMNQGGPSNPGQANPGQANGGQANPGQANQGCILDIPQS